MAETSKAWSDRLSRMAAALVVAVACTTFAVEAQMPTDPNAPVYAPYPDPNAAPPPEKGAFKKLFAGTLAAVLQTTGAGLATGLATVMTGAIQNWFNKPPKTPPPMTADAMGGMGGMTPGAMGSGMPGAMPTMPPMSTDPMGGMTMPTTPGMPADPNAASTAMGMPQAGMPAPGMMPATSGIVAGLAYEVQLLAPGGQTMTVDPATHYFATGDRFVVMYRPSLPGQVAIYNVNPLGQEKLIDSINVAAGELTRLGPYEFRHNTGTEVLRLILSPCRNDGLMATTRDIVKVDEMASPVASSPPSGALTLQDCAIVASRSVRPETRDIVKVGAEDGTMFALDPVSQQEIQAGNFTARELTLTFNHR
jgi:hypothetical protein